MSFVDNIHFFQDLKIDTRQIIALLTLGIMIVSSLVLFVTLTNSPEKTNSQGQSTTSVGLASVPGTFTIPDSIGQVVKSGYSDAVAVNPDMSLTVLVALDFNNPTILNNYLSDVQNPSSGTYHQYLSREQFSELFSPSVSAYSALSTYFSQRGLKVSTFSDFVSLKLNGPASLFEQVFNTNIMNMTMNGRTFYAPVKSLSLHTDISSISAVIGLNNYIKVKSRFTTDPTLLNCTNYNSYYCSSQ